MKIWRRKFLGAALACLLAIAVPLAPAVASGSDTLVFAAASLTDALTTIAKNYEAETGRKVTLSFAGSSVLARQIEAAAVVDHLQNFFQRLAISDNHGFTSLHANAC